MHVGLLCIHISHLGLSLASFAGGWSDTPDSACLAAVDHLERQHAVCHPAGPAEGTGPPAGAAETPVPARQLSFTPTSTAAAVVPVAVGLSPLTSNDGRRQPQLPTSHLGRSAMQLAEAALHQEQQAVAGVPPPLLAVLGQDLPPAPALPAQQRNPAPCVPPAGGGFHNPLPPPQQQQHTAVQQQQQQTGAQPGSLAAVPVAGQKRMLAATLALERIHAQHSPAAKPLQPTPGQLELVQAGPREYDAEPSRKRPRVQLEPDAGTAAAGAMPATAAGAAAQADGPSAVPSAEAVLPPFDYCELWVVPATSCARQIV